MLPPPHTIFFWGGGKLKKRLPLCLHTGLPLGPCGRPGRPLTIGPPAAQENKSFGKHNTEHRQATVTLKLLCNHLQLLAMVGAVRAAWPHGAAIMLRALDAVVNLNVDFPAFVCAFRAPFLVRVALYMCSPFLVLLVSTCGFVVTWYYNEYSRGVRSGPTPAQALASAHWDVGTMWEGQWQPWAQGGGCRSTRRGSMI